MISKTCGYLRSIALIEEATRFSQLTFTRHYAVTFFPQCHVGATAQLSEIYLQKLFSDFFLQHGLFIDRCQKIVSSVLSALCRNIKNGKEKIVLTSWQFAKTMYHDTNVCLKVEPFICSTFLFQISELSLGSVVLFRLTGGMVCASLNTCSTVHVLVCIVERCLYLLTHSGTAGAWRHAVIGVINIERVGSGILLT